MPNCFQLISRVTGQAEVFTDIDDKMCKDFGIEPDPQRYYYGWYDIIGLSVACGKTLPELIERYENEYHDEDLTRIAKWLWEHYTTDAWAEIGRR